MDDKVFATMIGAFLGFFLGLILQVIKERLDFNKRVALFRVSALHLAKSLSKYLHQDPSLGGGIDIKMINSCVDGASRSKPLGDIYEQLFYVFMDWSYGYYLPTGLKINELQPTKDQLKKLIKTLETLPLV